MRRDACRAAGLERVAAQVAQRLSQQDFVAFDRPELSADRDRAGSRQRVRPDFVRGPFGEVGHVDTGERQLRGLGEVQEVGDHLAEGFGLVANALHILLEFRGKPLESSSRA